MKLRLNTRAFRKAIYERYDYNPKSTSLFAKDMNLSTTRLNDFILNEKHDSNIPRVHTLYPMLKALNLKFEDVVVEVSDDTDEIKE